MARIPPPLANSEIVRVCNLSKSYKGKIALKDISLEVKRGEIFGLLGPDGSGKSTLMKIIAGVLAFDKGSLEVFGIKVDSERSAELIKSRIGFMPQGLGLNLYAELSVEENINFFARLRGLSEDRLREIKSKLLAITRLDGFQDRQAKHLSGGMKQKLGLICTLIGEPEFVILDEPTTGVDPVSRRDFWNILYELVRKEALTAIVSTAYLDEAERFHRLAFVYDGQIIATGTPESLRSLVKEKVLEIVATPQLEALSRLKRSFERVVAIGDRIRVFFEESKEEKILEKAKEVLQELSVAQMETGVLSLEEVFIALLSQRGLKTKELNIDFNGRNYKANEKRTVIKAKDLSRSFGAFKAVDKVSFEVLEGEIFGLLGANGAGKTTLIKMLAGILRPTGGEGKVAEVDMRKASHFIKERIGYVSQSFSLYHDLSVFENLMLFGHIYDISPKIMRNRLLEVVELTGLKGMEKELAKNLPLGMKQRLALACAILHSPKILFLDEPTSGVDPLGRLSFWEILSYLSRLEGVAILVTTHYMSEAEHCDRLVLMHKGRIVAYDSPKGLKDALKREVGELLEIVTEDPMVAFEILKNRGYWDVSLFGRAIHLFSKNPPGDIENVRRILDGSSVFLKYIGIKEPALEDVFVHRVRELEGLA